MTGMLGSFGKKALAADPLGKFNGQVLSTGVVPGVDPLSKKLRGRVSADLGLSSAKPAAPTGGAPSTSLGNY